MKRLLCLFASLLLMLGAVALAEDSARDEMIDGILALARQKYLEADGQAQRAYYAHDTYVCKNYTVCLFRQVAKDYRMAEFPNVALAIPYENNPAEKSHPYAYGVEWFDLSAKEGNPFEVAASFRYDSRLSDAENREKARAFMQQAQRGDFLQMAGRHEYGTGPHSLILMADYDPQTDSVQWADSNLRGYTSHGERYGYVQYGVREDIDWFVDAISQARYGATLYRLRDDIVRVDAEEKR